MGWLLWLSVLTLAVWLGRRILAARSTAATTPALRLAGGPPDAARDEGADEQGAGGPLLDAIAAMLRAGGAEVAEVEPDDWGVRAPAIVAGQPLTLKLGAHGENGVGPIWLLVLDGADDSARLRRTVEAAATAVAGVRVLGWDD